MLSLQNLYPELDLIGLEQIHTPFLIEKGCEGYYGDDFNGYCLRGANINFNLLTKRHYSILKNLGKTGVYSPGQGYDVGVFLLIQVFSEEFAHRVTSIIEGQNISYTQAINRQKYKDFINFNCKIKL